MRAFLTIIILLHLAAGVCLGTARADGPSPVYPMISQELQRFFSRAIAEKGSDIPTMATAASERIGRFVKLGARVSGQ